MTGAACGAGNAYPSGAPDFTSGFHRGSCCPVICVSLLHVIVLSFDCSFDCLASIFSWRKLRQIIGFYWMRCNCINAITLYLLL